MSKESPKHWQIFSTIQNKIVAKDLSKKQAVTKRIEFMGTVEFSNDILKLTTGRKK